VNASELDPAPGRRGWFLAAADVVGDLGHPFYGEERQRDVWNEACAVGLQLVLWLGLAAATAMVWVGGAAAVPYMATLLTVGAAGAWMTVLYARRLGIRLDDAGGVLRLRLLPYAVLLVALLIGVLRVAPSGGFGGGFVRGMVVGSAVALVWMVVSGIRARRRARADDA
jgi:hypothetical protein